MAANYVLLEKITVGAAGVASVTFNNIPQTGYTDLKVVGSSRQDAATGNTQIVVQFNGSTTGYSRKVLYGDGSVAYSYGSSGDSSSRVAFTEPSNYTANTFNNFEMYIPNYTSSNYKSVSSDSVTENNATGAEASMHAALWSNSAAITSVKLFDVGGSNFVRYSTFSLYGLAAVGATPVIDPKATGGDIIQTDGTYWYHAFINSGNFVPKANLTCDVLVVAGGGGGGGYAYGGGGGAGGLLGFTSQTFTSGTSQTVVIGAGGTGGPASTTVTATNGSNSSLGSLTAAVGGGKGGSFTTGINNGGTGGSGGGGAAQDVTNGTGGSATSGQGNAGGAGQLGAPYRGGGGGGASVAGTAGTSSAGNGGQGSSSYSSWGAATSTGQNSGGTYYYAGGGGGGGGAAGSGGLGGGGTGGLTSNYGPTAGTPNTGGGGGGSDYAVTNVGGNGGSGIVIVRYTVA